jgi:Fibronectin type III domain/Right handed beta helix region
MSSTILSLRRLLFACTVAFSAFALPSVASAANFYVDNSVSASGNGSSWASAWKNFSNINWGSIHGGDTLYISGGSTSQTYNETLTVGASGTSGNPITITKGVDAGHNGTVILDEQNTRWNGVYSTGKSWLTIQNLSVRNITDAGISVRGIAGGVIVQNNNVYSGGSGTNNARGYDIRDSSGVIVRNNIYHTPQSTQAQTDGIWLSGNSNLTVENNQIYVENNDDWNHDDCLQAYKNTGNITIRNNYCAQLGSPDPSYANYADNNNHGIWIQDMPSGTVTSIYNNVVYMAHATFGIGFSNPDAGYSGSANIYNNTVSGGWPSVYIGKAPNSQLKNNIIRPTIVDGTYAVHIDGSVPAGNMNNNLIWAPNAIIALVNNNNYSWPQWQGLGYDTNGINADPQFVNAAGQDFHLQPSSPAIDHGTTLAAVTTDKEGIIRPQGGAYDIGAYEFGGGSGDTTSPSVPTNLTATAVSSSQINLSWTASTDNVGVTGYRVERCQDAGCTNFAQIATPTGTTASDTGLSASTSYSYRVRATDAANNLSGYSATASAITPAASGPTLSASPAAVAPGASVTASWAGVTAPTVRDWIGVYVPGAANSAYNTSSWRYTSSCTKTAGTTAKASGSCPIPMPSTAGTYELRLFANDGFTLIAKSPAITVN